MYIYLYIYITLNMHVCSMTIKQFTLIIHSEALHVHIHVHACITLNMHVFSIVYAVCSNNTYIFFMQVTSTSFGNA